jgi:DASS family divalent anion:Na+ symporter
MTINIKSIPHLSDCSLQDLAKLAPYIKEHLFEDGDEIFNEGDRAETFFFIYSGSVSLSAANRHPVVIDRGMIGVAVVINLDHYLYSATASGQVLAISIPRGPLTSMLTNYAGVREAIHRSFLDQIRYGISPFKVSNDKKRDIEGDTKKEKSQKSAESRLQIFGWVLALIVPVLTFWVCTNQDMPWEVKNFFVIISAAIVMWVFRLAPEYIPTIFAILAVIVLGIVPGDVVLKGYSSPSFFLAMSVFAIGAVLAASGLAYRISLLILKRMPKSQFWNNLAMFITGLTLTPVLPSANGRVGLLAPILTNMIEALGYKKGGRAATFMVVSTFVGTSLFSAVFLTSKSVNFVLYGLFPLQVKHQFTFTYWFTSALMAALVLVFAFWLLGCMFFKNDEPINLQKQHIDTQLDVLGPMSKAEWIALISILFFIAGVATSSIHKIMPAWIGLATLYLLLSLNAISKKMFRKDIDWTFLMMLGGFVGLVQVMNYIGIDRLIADQLHFMGALMTKNFYLFILALAIFIYLLRLMIPNIATIILMASVLMPVAIDHGFNPWLIAFMVLMFSDGWFMPYQCTYYLLLDELCDKRLFNRRKMIHFNFYINIFRILAVWASVVYWKLIGIL